MARRGVRTPWSGRARRCIADETINRGTEPSAHFVSPPAGRPRSVLTPLSRPHRPAPAATSGALGAGVRCEAVRPAACLLRWGRTATLLRLVHRRAASCARHTRASSLLTVGRGRLRPSAIGPTRGPGAMGAPAVRAMPKTVLPSMTAPYRLLDTVAQYGLPRTGSAGGSLTRPSTTAGPGWRLCERSDFSDSVPAAAEGRKRYAIVTS